MKYKKKNIHGSKKKVCNSRKKLNKTLKRDTTLPNRTVDDIMISALAECGYIIN